MPVELCTILFVNKRRIQPATREALLKIFESGKSFGVVEVERDEMDGFLCIPFTPIDQKMLKKALAKPKPPAEPKPEEESDADAIERLVSEGKQP